VRCVGDGNESKLSSSYTLQNIPEPNCPSGCGWWGYLCKQQARTHLRIAKARASSSVSRMTTTPGTTNQIMVCTCRRQTCAFISTRVQEKEMEGTKATWS
jgi:hypothetical protein